MRKKKRHNRFICDHCLPDVEELGEVVPGMWLGRDKDGKFVLVGSPFDSHGGKVFHKFTKDPWIDPLEKRPGETEKQWEKRYDSAPKPQHERNIAWIRMAKKELGWKIGLDDVMTMSSMLGEGGWTRKKGCASIWLYERCARIAEGAKGRRR